MSFQLQQTKLAILWILPTWLEVFVYAVVSAVTMAISNFSFFKQLFYIPNHLNLYQDSLDSINQLVQRLVGERIAGSLSLGIFWGLVGMLVYVIIWLLQNFSTELSNDLAMTKYVVPRGSDPRQTLRDFISVTIFRILTLLTFVFYINLVIRVLVSTWVRSYYDMFRHWPQSHFLIKAGLAFVFQMVILHGFVVFARILALRKRIFN